MRKLILAFSLLMAVQGLVAQEKTVQGRITDTLERKDLYNAVICLIKKSDSTLAAFTRSDRQGRFHINNISPGKYSMLITYPGYADFSDDLEVKDGQVTEAGSIAMTHKAKLLQNVVIRSAAAIRIKGDTTEFVADSFAVREGATVEELLKKMPGFQVNSKGEITAMGQKVQKVLVDGEEFFGDDPTIATQNISARAVDRVQVYDTKSEQEQLTGISSGDEGKTVNIKLKEEAKKGSFGKAHAASNFGDLADAKGMYNRFMNKKKMSVFGAHSRISGGGLEWDERDKLGLSDEYEYDDDNDGMYFMVTDGSFGQWNYEGLPKSSMIGGLFANKWDEDRHNVNTSYNYNQLATFNDASTLTQNILPNSVTYRNTYQTTNTLSRKHSINGKYEWKTDSLTSFRFTTWGSYRTSSQTMDINSEFLGEGKTPTNRSHQQRSQEGENVDNQSQLFYKQLFKKKGRQLMATLGYSMTDDDQKGIVRTMTEFYRDGLLDSVDLADQQKIMDARKATLSSRITYNEPLKAKWNLVTEYAFRNNASSSYLNTYNKSANGKYEVLDSDFSNNFDLDATTHSSSAVLRYMDKKWRTSVGSGISSVKMKLLDLGDNSRRQFHFLNITPKAQVSYNYKPQSSISLRYHGSTMQPTINQLQPIRDNTDRLNQMVGNPDLKVGFEHEMSLSFRQYKTLTGSGLSLSLEYSIQNNAITFLNTLDLSTGAQTQMPVNVNGNSNWSFWGHWSKGAPGGKWRVVLFSNSRGGKNINFVNGQKNETQYSRLNLGPRLNYDAEKRGFSITPDFGWNRSASSLTPSQNTSYWEYGGDVDGYLTLPGKLELRSDCNFQLRQRINAFDINPNQIIWNATLAKKIFKDESGRIMIVANDLLNQNRGFRRNITSNFISEQRYSLLSRYVLLKLEWSFNKMPGQKETDQ
jgi:hypothetical protein